MKLFKSLILSVVVSMLAISSTGNVFAMHTSSSTKNPQANATALKILGTVAGVYFMFRSGLCTTIGNAAIESVKFAATDIQSTLKSNADWSSAAGTALTFGAAALLWKNNYIDSAWKWVNTRVFPLIGY